MEKSRAKFKFPKAPEEIARDWMLILVSYAFSAGATYMIENNWLAVGVALAYFIVAFGIFWRLDNKARAKRAKEQEELLTYLAKEFSNKEAIEALSNNMPSKEDINNLTTAINKLTDKIR